MKKTLCALAVISGLNLVYAEEKHHHDETDPVGHIGPHVHGEAQLNVVLDGDDLIVLLDSPAMNIIGFEHQPNTDAQFDQSHEALHTLEDLDELLTIPNGQCQLASSHLDWKYKELVHERYHGDEKHDDHKHDDHKHDDHKHDDHKHDDHKHDDHKHDDHKHDDHKHDDHKHDDHDHGEHSDITAKFAFECQSPEKIKALQVGLFEVFPRLEKLNVQWIVGDNQGSQTLVHDNNVLRFE